MTLTQLEYIVALAKYANFGAASKASFVTQPTLSIQVAKLENELEVIIFDRSKKPLKPTAIGEKIIEQAKVVLNESKRIEQILLDTRDVLEGEFRLGIIPSVSGGLLPLFLSSFIEKYPKVKLVLSELQTMDMLKKLENEEIDAGIASTPLGDSSLIEESLYYEPFYLYLNSDHPLYQKAEIFEKDLYGEDLLLLSEGHCFRNQVSQICKLRKSEGVVFESGNFGTLISLVEKNLGITLLPYLTTEQIKSKDQRNRIKKFAGKVPSREIGLVYRRKHLKQGILKALKSSILETLPDMLKDSNKKMKKIIDPKIS
ncbi:MAG: hydrogen peroxide-inducible genes activator [Epsilonproteobacteria bacterium]|nr:MAG: hydrogen peroxide-inducible genes activator [Campylobacterota bacterium]RLA65305.1 MAG: hydrogen peroxide-inducible genes activator [Campylobacterota bacterium]